MDINKLFLANTIRSVESHNKREEEADCWRQHEMIHKSTELRRQQRHGDDVQSKERRRPNNFNESEDNLVEEREHWAHKKARVLSAAQQSDQIIQAFCEANLPLESSSKKSVKSDKKKKDKKKKDKKKKDKKKDKKKEKKKKKDNENYS